MSKIEEFFGDFANSICGDDALDNADVLLEITQGVMTGFAYELIALNDGEYYVLSIFAHEEEAWNFGNLGFSSFQTVNETLYRFESLSGALEALSRFQAAVMLDQMGE